MKRILVPFLLLFAIYPSFPRESFVVDSYDVSIHVDASASSRVEERLDVDFTSPSHGLFRDIQYDFGIGMKAEISDVRTNVRTEGTYEDGYLVLRLGEADKLVRGPAEYLISYDYMIPEVRQRGFERWYYNVLSAAWDTEIRDFTFSVTFPYPVDASKVHVTYGAYGETRSAGYDISSDGRTVFGRLSSLPPYSGVTVLAEFEEGYFDLLASKTDFSTYGIAAAFVLSALFSAFALVSYRKYGRDEELVCPVQFSPPDGLSSLDCGYIADDGVDADTDALSMVFYWADKGYMRIEEDGKGGYRFIRLADVPEDRPPYERNLFDVFFEKGSEVSVEDVARSGFREKLEGRIFPDMKRYYEKNHPLEDRTSRMRSSLISTMGIILSIGLAVLISLSEIGEATLLVLVPQLIVIFAMMALHRKIRHDRGILSCFKGFARTVATLVLLCLTFSTSAIAGYMLTRNILPCLLAGVSSSLTAFSATFVANAVRRRSGYGYSILCKVLGYKEFLKEVEVEKLKVLVGQDPEYFYHNLAYAVAFKLEDSYIRKFSGLTVSVPGWYSGTNLVMDYMFWHMFASSWRSDYSRVYSSIHPSSRPGGGGFRGGSFGGSGFSGFAGGGFSGGGGRSW